MQKNFHFCELNLPAAPLKVALRGEQYEVYDPLRAKWLVLTDEEWVRQHFVADMINRLGYPASVMANEVGLMLNRTRRRADTVVYGRDCKPLMIVEYKAPGIEITQQVFDQIVRYNMTLRARYLAVSNGLVHYCCAIDYANNSYAFLPELPRYEDIIY